MAKSLVSFLTHGVVATLRIAAILEISPSYSPSGANAHPPSNTIPWAHTSSHTQTVFIGFCMWGLPL